MNIALSTNSELKHLELQNIRKTGHLYICFLSMESRGLSAFREFIFEQPGLQNFLKELIEMDASFEGEAYLEHYNKSDYFSIKCFKKGHIIVSGAFVDEDEFPQSLEFCFQTDQTILQPLIKAFTKLRAINESKA